jgi:hypothetical protein
MKNINYLYANFALQILLRLVIICNNLYDNNYHLYLVPYRQGDKGVSYAVVNHLQLNEQ